jgi:flavin reductase (DIM6/NTAB) family NADH-FMN oxidoreductase RutF
MLGIGINRAHHTKEGIEENGTFSVNVPRADMVDKVTAAAWYREKRLIRPGFFGYSMVI